MNLHGKIIISIFCVFSLNPATDSQAKLPPILTESCH